MFYVESSKNYYENLILWKKGNNIQIQLNAFKSFNAIKAES